MMQLICDRCRGKIHNNPPPLLANQHSPLIVEIRIINGHACHLCMGITAAEAILKEEKRAIKEDRKAKRK